MTEIPDYVPMLIKGTGATPERGGCLVQIANWLSDETLWTDLPLCVHPTLARWSITINDLMEDEDRHKLALLAPRLAGTAERNRGEGITDLQIASWLNIWIKANPSPLRIETKRIYTWQPHGMDVCLDQIYYLDNPEQAANWLAQLIDECDRVTGRGRVPLLTEEQGRNLRAVMCQ